MGEIPLELDEATIQLIQSPAHELTNREAASLRSIRRRATRLLTRFGEPPYARLGINPNSQPPVEDMDAYRKFGKERGKVVTANLYAPHSNYCIGFVIDDPDISLVENYQRLLEDAKKSPLRVVEAPFVDDTTVSVITMHEETEIALEVRARNPHIGIMVDLTIPEVAMNECLIAVSCSSWVGPVTKEPYWLALASGAEDKYPTGALQAPTGFLKTIAAIVDHTAAYFRQKPASN